MARPDVFGGDDGGRPGRLFDRLLALADHGAIAAPAILSEVLRQFGPIWPSRITLGGVPLGDCWRHPALTTADATSQLMPLHKLSQWLTYSLIEPLQRAAVSVHEIDGLTGLAEYRNGGLFVDTGVLAFRDEADWRETMTSARRWWWSGGRSPSPCSTGSRTTSAAGSASMRWHCRWPRCSKAGPGRPADRVAFARRRDGASPVRVISDGTVF